MPKVIDTHVHPANELLIEHGGESLQYGFDYFGKDFSPEPIEETVEKYREWGIDRAVLFALDSETNTGNPAIPNDWVAEMREKYELFLGFASVDPHKGQTAREEAVRAIEDLGLDGFKFQQAVQGFTPSNRRFDDLWALLEDLGKPVLFHGGHTAIGAGSPGGSGLMLKHTRPVHIDEVAARYPNLQIIIAHPAWPYHQEQLSTVIHKSNVYMDLSGWQPEYIPDEVIQYAKSRISHKVLFGSDYPVVTPEDWLDGFEELDFDEEAREMILHENAEQLLDL
ncbi:amidohydrolase family protein [Natrialba swarupiae]|uniref:amidohydrolase family protein n=1 Tax=Natrialba swarupiae TaxID=2448032 RepID=UPI001EE4761F|nr:amidohydrolase family protein [Natrialba swarupiae]